MSRSHYHVAHAAVVMLTLLYSSAAFALRCGNDLASPGDRKIQVLKKCGEPLLIEHWEEEGIVVDDSGVVVSGTLDIHNVEEWTYNFGPSRFMQFLRFVDGKLDRIAAGPRGFAGTVHATGTAECGNIVSVGDRKFEVFRKCGQPKSVDTRISEQVIGMREKNRTLSQARRLRVNVEEWTYNFGPTRFLVFITLENGVVVDVQSGDYGF